MAKCPKCGNEINWLKAYCTEENKYSVELEEGVHQAFVLDWSSSEIVEGSCTKTEFECPVCDETLFTVEGSDSQPKEVIAFLRGETAKAKTV